MEAVLATLYKAIGLLAVGIQPVIPTRAARLLDHMGIAEEFRSYGGVHDGWYKQLLEGGFIVAPPQPLFPRLELPADPA